MTPDTKDSLLQRRVKLSHILKSPHNSTELQAHALKRIMEIDMALDKDVRASREGGR